MIKMQSIEQLDRRIPLVSDKLLVDLVNGIQVSKGIVNYRKSRGFFGRLLDSLTGGDYKRQVLLEGNFLAGHEALHNWVLEITDSLRISQVALKITQSSLLEARSAIRSYKEDFVSHIEDFNVLSGSFDQLVAVVDDIELRLEELKIKNSAKDDFDRIVATWIAKQTYKDLPWVFQVVLLIKEIFSSSIPIYELKTGDTNYFRQLLASKILSESTKIPDNFFDLHKLYENAFHQLQNSDIELVGDLLNVNPLPRSRLLNLPYHFTLSTGLDFFSLPASIQPTKPAECAIELCRSRLTHIEYVTDKEDFIKKIVKESADDSISILSKRAEL